jgi:large conductance mechanosensitive channel
MLKEFREFAMKGNVVDLAVGLVIGAAFGAIVNSLVADVIMPVIGVFTGGIDFSDRYFLLRNGNPPGPYLTLAAAKQAGAVTLNIGAFISLIINFVIIAFALFLVVKAMNRMRRAQIETPAPPPAPTREEILLAEIRDLLRTGRAV